MISAPLPERVGPYTVLGVLGQGGSGVVYLASRGDQRLAVKVLHARSTADGLAERVRREVAGLSRVHHPGIVEVVDAGADDRTPWIAMTYVEGTALRARIARPGPPPRQAALQTTVLPTWDGDGSPPPARGAPPETFRRAALSLPDALATMSRLCAALAHLHGEGVVHRDLKPDNVIVRPDGRPVLVDFGMVAAFEGGTRDSLDTLLHHGGTPAYMAPEQVRREPVDARADLYAVGVVLFELATGLPPFVGRADEVMAAHAERTPPRMSSFADVPPELDELVDALLRKDPHDRPGQAAEVAELLARMAGRASIDLGPPARPWLYRPRLAGRDALLADLADRTTTSARGEGAVIAVAGDAGVGKTRLVAELVQRRRGDGIPAAWGACHPSGEPLGALRPVLRAVAARSAAARAALEVGDRRGILARFEPSFGAPSDSVLVRELVFSHLRAFLAAEQRPRLVVIDDLQDADELLDPFVRWLAARPIPGLVVVGTWRGGGEPPGDVVRLPALDRAGVAQVVGDMLSNRSLPEALVDEVAAASGGNPLFVAEALRWAVEERVVTRSGALGWGATGPVAPFGTIDAVCERRLGRLGAPARRAVAAAALVCPTVDVDRLLRLAQVPPEALAEAVARQVVHLTPEGVLQFVHERLQHAAVALVSPADLAALHRAAAEQLERDGGEPTAIARHWTEGGRPDRAQPFVLQAARAAFDRLALGEALGGYRRWLDRADPQDPETSRVRTHVGARILANQGRHAEALVELERSEHESRTAGDPGATLGALLGQAEVMRELGRIDDSAARCAEVARLAGDDAYWNMRLQLELGLRAHDRGDPAAGLQAYDAAVTFARRAGDPKGEGVALLALAGLRFQEGRSREAEALQSAGERLLGDQDPYAVASTAVNHLVFRMQAEAPEVLEVEAVRLEQRYRAAGLPVHLAVSLAVAATCRERLGRPAEAEAAIREAIDVAAASGNDRQADVYLEDLARVVLAQARAEEALPIALRAVERCAGRGARPLVHARLRAAACHLALGAVDAAEAELDRVAAVEPRDAEATVELLCLRGQAARVRGASAAGWLAEARRAAADLGSQRADALVAALAARSRG